MPKIMSLAIGTPKEYTWNHQTKKSGIGKSSTDVAVLKKSGFIGDDVANKEKHGGVDRAICLYPYEHYAYWETVLQKKLPIPAFGENLTVAGMTENQVCIGDIYQFGNVVAQVTQGRVPCNTISNFSKEKSLLKQVFETTQTGYFFRVLAEGVIKSNSIIHLLEKHPREVSVAFATNTLFHQHHDKAAIEKILAVDELSDEWRNRFLKVY